MRGIEITIFRKADGILSKRIALLKSGEIKADGSECRMAEGTARRVKLDGVASLAALIEQMPSEEALSLGRLRADLPDNVNVVCKYQIEDARAGTIARTGEYLSFAADKPAYLLLDHDSKNETAEVKAKLTEAGGFWNAIVSVVPALAGAARVHRSSTSAGLYHARSGKKFPGSANCHVYIVAKDGTDIQRALATLHERAWLAGYGYYMVGAAGHLLDRSIVDASVYGPERLVFEGQPSVRPPLAQDQELRRPQAFEGDPIDTLAAIPPLTDAEQEQLDKLKSEAKERLQPAALAARTVWARAFATRHGLSEQHAERIAAQAINHVLETEFELYFDDPELGVRTLADVLADPEHYIGETLADPLEGTGYGRNKAKVLRRRDRCLMIHSFAHGGINYQLAGQGVSLETFRAYKPTHTYIFTPTREPWPAKSVNATIAPIPLLDADGRPILDRKGNPKFQSAADWLDEHQSVEQITWCPGRDMDIEDYLVGDGGWIRRNGVNCLNLYRPADWQPGDPERAGRWLDHVYRVYPADGDHIIDYLAHRVQYPDHKINHALLLGGKQGIGKDTMLEPVKYAVGAWNYQEVSAEQVMGRFNGFLKSVILRISEAHDLGASDRYKFHDRMKAYTAAPPDVLRVDEKNLREHAVFNVCGVVITTNHKTDGIHLDADDRRYYVAWSDLEKEDFDKNYWKKLWGWYESGGIWDVAAYLAERDISAFDAKAPPPKTEAFWAIVDVGRAPEEAELADVLAQLADQRDADGPDVVTLAQIIYEANSSFRDWLSDRRNRRAIPHRLEACGYVQVRNDTAKDGLWVIEGKRQVIYAKSSLSMVERVRAARRLQQAAD